MADKKKKKGPFEAGAAFTRIPKKLAKRIFRRKSAEKRSVKTMPKYPKDTYRKTRVPGFVKEFMGTSRKQGRKPTRKSNRQSGR